MRGELKGVFILFKLTSQPTHRGAKSKGIRRGGCVWVWAGHSVSDSPTHTHTHTPSAYANHCEF